MLEFSLKKIQLANYLLGIFILAAALMLTRNIISISFSEKAHDDAEKISLQSAVSRDRNIMQYAVILEKNPFGTPMEFRPLSVSQKTEKQFNSLSNLVLVGTVTGPVHLSYAVFEDKSQSASGNQEIFTYGERVFNYGILTGIHPSSVEIEQDSTTYTVTIPFEKMTTEFQNHQSQSTVPPQTTFAKKVGERQYLLNSRIVQQSLENPEHMLTDARLLPNFNDGRQEGFSISEVVPDGLYDNLGMKNGDILLRINGLEISNPEVAIQAMSALRGMNRINLDIMRDGKKMSMNYQIK